ncbi:MAG: universal stress protein, partial [Planctomycetota bacterium]
MPTRSALLHIYRDTPMGREHLMQSAYFCKKQFGLVLSVFIPEAIQFTLQLESEIFPVQLDASYVASDPEQARKRVEEIVQPFACPLDFVIADPVGSSGIPHLPGEWGIMTCPRVISEQSSRIGLGRIGPKVRALVKAAPFPVFIP